MKHSPNRWSGRAAFLLVAVLTVSGCVTNEVSLGPGVIAPQQPQQITLRQAAVFQSGDYRVTPLAGFRITAKVLARENYRWGREADLSPVDLALGWGRMSDEAVLKDIDIWQSGRWYRWRTKHFPIPRQEIETHSANMHMIPANDQVDAALRAVKKGQVVAITGKLVRVEGDDGWRWVSSLSRSDTGARACELVWVEEVAVIMSGDGS